MSDNNTVWDTYQVIFTDGREDIIMALTDDEARQIADNYEVIDRSTWEYRTKHLTPESIYRMDDWGQFTERVY